MTVEFGPERDLLTRVLRLWAKRRTAARIEVEKALSSQMQSLNIADPDYGLTRLKDADLPVELDIRREGFLMGPPVRERAETLQPVASIRLKQEGEGLNVCIRLATYYLDRRGVLAADGWRFESGETAEDAPHPWAHVQRTTRWHKEDETLLDPILLDPSDESAWSTEACPHIVDETRPAIPLGCRTSAGLALTMVGSLHGGPFLQSLIDADAKLKRSLHRPDGEVLLLRL
jgi:hypothetical protein